MNEEVERIQMTERGWGVVELVEDLISSGFTVEEAAKVLNVGSKTLQVLLKIAEISRDTLEEELRG